MGSVSWEKLGANDSMWFKHLRKLITRLICLGADISNITLTFPHQLLASPLSPVNFISDISIRRLFMLYRNHTQRVSLKRTFRALYWPSMTSPIMLPYPMQLRCLSLLLSACGFPRGRKHFTKYSAILQ